MWLDHNSYELWWMRFLIGGTMIAFFTASFYSRKLQANFVRISYVFPIVCATSYIFLMYKNNLSLPYAFGYMIILGIALVYKEHKIMLGYLLLCTLTLFVSLSWLKEPIIDLAVFLTVSTVTATVFYIVYYSRIVLMEQLQLQEQKAMLAERETLEFKVKVARQNALAQQMNPHFLSNAMNSVQFFILKNDVKSSIKYLSTFTSLMRENLLNAQSTHISLEQELSALAKYMELEKLRMNHQFTYSIYVEESLARECQVPPLILQPFVENAILHGFASSTNKGVISIKIQKDSALDMVVCLIDDTGDGFKKADSITDKKHVSFGSTITRDRVDLINSIYGKESTIKTINKADKGGDETGVLVELRLPYIKKDCLINNFESQLYMSE